MNSNGFACRIQNHLQKRALPLSERTEFSQSIFGHYPDNPDMETDKKIWQNVMNFAAENVPHRYMALQSYRSLTYYSEND